MRHEKFCCRRQSKRRAHSKRSQQFGGSTGAYFATLRVLIALSRVTLLAPIGHSRHITRPPAEASGYRAHAALSVCSVGACLTLAAAAPWLIRAHTSVYGVSDIATDTRFQQVALVSVCSDYAVSLLILAAQLWQRHGLARFLNTFNALINDVQRLLQRQFIGWPYTLLLWLRIAHFLYGLSMNLPFLIRHGGELSAARGPLPLLACAVTLVVEQLSRVFALGVFAALLLFTACYAQLERRLLDCDALLVSRAARWRWQRQRQTELCDLVNALQTLLQHFVRTFELAIFLLLIGEFVNLLANLYGLVYHSVLTASVYPNLIAYNLSLALNLYSLIFCAHLCNRQRDRIKHAIRTFTPPQTPTDAATLTPASATTSSTTNSDWLQLTISQPLAQRSPLDAHPMWPSPVPLSILGLFNLSHEFWLCLVSYAVNFLVIILQFAVEERKRLNG